jgi:hypothetical protein
MLSVLLGTTTITMNRGEQETLYIQARNLRLHQESKAQLSSQNTLKPRHHSYGNIHSISTYNRHQPHHPQGFSRLSHDHGDSRSINATADDLVLSVLKSPLRDQSLLSNLSSVAATSINSDSIEGGSVNRMSTVTTLTTTTIDNAPSASDNNNRSKAYTTQFHASEDDLAADDVELTMETTELNDRKESIENTNSSPYGLRFLRRFRAPKFEAHHHRRVPTPMRRKHNRGRSKSTADILDGVNTPNPDEEVAMQQNEGGSIV